MDDAVRDLDDRTQDRRLARSVIGQVLGQVAMSALGVLIVKVITTRLGADDYGYYATGLNFVYAFALVADLGLSSVTVRDIAKRPEDAQAILGHNMGLRLTLAVGAIPLIYVLGLIVYPTQPTALHAAIAVFAFYVLFDSIRQIAASYLTAHIRNDIVALIQTLQQVVTVALVLLIVAEDGGVVLLAAAFIGGNAAAALTSVLWVRRKVPVRPLFVPHHWRGILAASLAIGALQIINEIYLKLDGIIVSLLKGPRENGIYSVSYLLIAAVTNVPLFLMSAMVPSIATATAEQLRDRIGKAVRLIATVACLVVAATLPAARDLVLFVSSAAFGDAALPFQILVASNVLVAMTVVFTYASVSLDKHRPLLVIMAITLVTNLALNLVLVPFLGIRGSALATIPSGLLTLVLMHRVFARDTGLVVRVVAPLVRPVLASAAACAVTLWQVTPRVDHLQIVARLAITGGAGTALFATVLLLIGGVRSLSPAAQPQPVDA